MLKAETKINRCITRWKSINGGNATRRYKNFDIEYLCTKWNQKEFFEKLYRDTRIREYEQYCILGDLKFKTCILGDLETQYLIEKLTQQHLR